jgi:hypothetical protein
MKTLIYGKNVHEGDIVTWVSDTGDRYPAKVSTYGYCSCYASMRNNSFNNYRGGIPENGIQEALPEEKKWLEMCIEEGQLVSFDRAVEVCNSEKNPSIINDYSLF